MNLDNAFSIYIFKCAFASNRISREWGRVGFSCQRGGMIVVSFRGQNQGSGMFEGV